MSCKDYVFSCNDLSYIKRRQFLFKNASFILQSCSSFLLSGHDHSLNSFLKIIFGLLKQNTGEFKWNTNNLEYCSNNKIYAIIDNINIFDNYLTVFQNLKFWANFYNTDATLDAIIFYLGLSEILNKASNKLHIDLKIRLVFSILMLSQAKVWFVYLYYNQSELSDMTNELILNAINAHISSGGVLCSINNPFLLDRDKFKLVNIN